MIHYLLKVQINNKDKEENRMDNGEGKHLYYKATIVRTFSHFKVALCYTSRKRIYISENYDDYQKYDVNAKFRKATNRKCARIILQSNKCEEEGCTSRQTCTKQ